jgi:hypothetical protein
MWCKVTSLNMQKMMAEDPLAEATESGAFTQEVIRGFLGGPTKAAQGRQ